jgi:hypothetical protein
MTLLEVVTQEKKFAYEKERREGTKEASLL